MQSGRRFQCSFLLLLSGIGALGVPTPGVAQDLVPALRRAGEIRVSASVIVAQMVGASAQAWLHADSLWSSVNHRERPNSTELGLPGSGVWMVTEWIAVTPEHRVDAADRSSKSPTRLRVTVAFTAN